MKIKKSYVFIPAVALLLILSSRLLAKGSGTFYDLVLKKYNGYKFSDVSVVNDGEYYYTDNVKNIKEITEYISKLELKEVSKIKSDKEPVFIDILIENKEGTNHFSFFVGEDYLDVRRPDNKKYTVKNDGIDVEYLISLIKND